MSRRITTRGAPACPASRLLTRLPVLHRELMASAVEIFAEEPHEFNERLLVNSSAIISDRWTLLTNDLTVFVPVNYHEFTWWLKRGLFDSMAKITGTILSAVASTVFL